MSERRWWHPSKKTTLVGGGLFFSLTIAGMIHFGEYDNVSNYPNIEPSEPPPTTLYLNPNVDFETAIAEATVPYFRYAISEREKADQMVMLWDVQELTPIQIQTLFNTIPAQNEKWYAGLYAATDARDGGPKRAGFQIGDHILALSEDAIHGVGHISNAVKRSSHPGDVEEMVVFTRLINGEIIQEGAYIWQHGEGKYFHPDEFQYIKDENENLHILAVKAIQKGTIDSSTRNCNTDKKRGTVDIEVAGIHIINLHGTMLPNRCAHEKDTFEHQTEIDPGNNFGDGNNPFVINQENIGFGIHENVHNNCYYGDLFDNETEPDKVAKEKEELPCASQFRTEVPMVQMRE